MRNRAKCKKCNKVIESMHYSDYVTCDCGEIAIWGGLQKAFTDAKNYENFLRIDDEGKEVVVKYMDAKKEIAPPEQPQQITKESLLDELDAKIKYDLELPKPALFASPTTCDMVNYMMLISAVLRKI